MEFLLRELRFPFRETFLTNREFGFPLEDTARATRCEMTGFAKFTISDHYAERQMSWMIRLWPQVTAMSGST
jgi:hypothetical protein